MATVTFTIGKHSYELACAEGEQEKIQNIAAKINSRISSLSGKFQSASDHMLLSITALIMEDEIESLKEQSESSGSLSLSKSINKSLSEDELNDAVINIIEPVTKYIETLADSLEKV